MKRRIIILAALVVGLMISLPVTLIAQTTRTIVSGVMDFADGRGPAEIGFKRWTDSGGRTHINNLIARGNFTLAGESTDLAGKWAAVFSTFFIDPQGNGRVSGPFTVTSTIDGQETAVWEGHYLGEGTNNHFSGFMWAVGSGPFEGKILELTFDEDDGAITEETPDPDIFLLSGVITEPPPPPAQ